MEKGKEQSTENALLPPSFHLPSELLLRVLRKRHVDDACVVVVLLFSIVLSEIKNRRKRRLTEHPLLTVRRNRAVEPNRLLLIFDFDVAGETYSSPPTQPRKEKEETKKPRTFLLHPTRERSRLGSFVADLEGGGLGTGVDCRRRGEREESWWEGRRRKWRRRRTTSAPDGLNLRAVFPSAIAEGLCFPVVGVDVGGEKKGRKG
jgi:hypothetical protein